VRINFVSPEYFPVLQIPLLTGRIWDKSENRRGARLAVINQTMALQNWPNGTAVGHQIRIPELKAEPPMTVAVPASDDWMEIVGIVADARNDGLSKPVKPAIYVPYTVWMPVGTQILVRSQVPPLSILHSVRAKIQTVDADQQAQGNVRSLEEWITGEPEWAQQHLIALLFGAFGFLALVLAAVGLFSVVSYGVAQRTNELGIRMALGAQRKDVLRIVFLSTGFSVASGILAGALLSLSLNRLVTSWSENSSIHPNIFACVTLLLICVAAMACFVPAKRASSIDPMKALRY
jgi:putative ABC transport system permease protein